MRRYLLILLSSLCVWVSCNKAGSDDVFREYLEVKIESSATRLELGDGNMEHHPVCWEQGDQIAVWEENGQKRSVYELVEGVGTPSGKFRYVSGDATSGVITDVIYPVSAATDSKVPEVQCYTEGSFDRGAIRMSWHSQFEDSGSPIVLHHETALLRFALTGVSSQKVSRIRVDMSGKLYCLEVPDVPLSSIARPFYLVIVPQDGVKSRVDFLVKDEGGEAVMTRQISVRSFVKGHIHAFQAIPFVADVVGRSFRMVSYNVGIFSKYVEDSAPMVADMMKEIGADLMVLDELDKNNKNKGRHDYDQLAKFAELLGWSHVFAPSVTYSSLFWKGYYGIGQAFSKEFVPLQDFTIKLPKVNGKEDRVCLVVEFDDFVLAGTHLDVKDHLEGAVRITQELKSRYAGKGKPVFLCGDMNAKPSSSTIAELKKDWVQLSKSDPTYPSTNPASCIDYIFALKNTGSYRLVNAAVGTHFKSGDVQLASDHLPIWVDIQLESQTGGASSEDYLVVEEIW